MGEVIYQFGVRYNHYWLNDGVDEDVWARMGRNRLRLNPEETEMVLPPESGGNSLVILNGAALPYSRLVHNLEVFLDSQFLFKEEMETVAQEAFAQAPVMPFPGLGGPSKTHL